MMNKICGILLGSCFLLVSLCMSDTGMAAAPPAEELIAVPLSAQYAYIGGYTTEKRGGIAKGITVFAISKEGRWTAIQTVERMNPSYLAMDAKKRVLYACQGDGKEVASFTIDPKTGKLTPLNTKESTGVNGVHLALSADDKYLAVANYVGATVDVFALQADGSIGERTGSVSTAGETGALKSQKGSYPHQTVFSRDGRFVLVPDKGRDLVHVLALDPASGKLAAHTSMYSRPSVGSRHLDLHPSLPYAYISEECDYSVTAARYDAAKGALTPVQWLPAAPDNHFYQDRGTNEFGGGGIWVSPDGKYVYVSQRGPDAIAIFAVNPKDGLLKPVGQESTRGQRPRFFTFDSSGAYMFVGNEVGHNIAAFAVDKESGKLKYLGDVARPGSPTCILFK